MPSGERVACIVLIILARDHFPSCEGGTPQNFFCIRPGWLYNSAQPGPALPPPKAGGQYPEGNVSLEPSVIVVPRVLPAWASQVSLFLEQIDEAAAKEIALPPAWLLAPAEPQNAYRAGRDCAMRALEQLRLACACPGVNANNAPAWPYGPV